MPFKKRTVIINDRPDRSSPFTHRPAPPPSLSNMREFIPSYRRPAAKVAVDAYIESPGLRRKAGHGDEPIEPTEPAAPNLKPYLPEK